MKVVMRKLDDLSLEDLLNAADNRRCFEQESLVEEYIKKTGARIEDCAIKETRYIDSHGNAVVEWRVVVVLP